jgi:hypothetical protein
MRGKKTDHEFIGEFISECIQKNIDTPDAMVKHAQNMIDEIDIEIQKVEARKVVRSKLLDVINNFDQPPKSKKEEAKVLPFFKIQYPIICKAICDSIKISAVDINSFNGKHDYADVLFCIKQLIEYKVIYKSGNHLLRGEMFEDYLKFALKED